MFISKSLTKPNFTQINNQSTFYKKIGLENWYYNIIIKKLKYHLLLMKICKSIAIIAVCVSISLFRTNLTCIGCIDTQLEVLL